MRGPMTILREVWTGEETTGNEAIQAYQYVFDLRNRLEETCKLTKENLLTAQSRYKTHFDKKTQVWKLEVGDLALVLLPTDHNKLLMHWKGPFVGETKVGLADYKVRVGDNLKVFHLNMLKKYLPRTEEIAATVAILNSSNDVSLDVESLLNTKPETVNDVKLSEDLDASLKMELLRLIKEYSGIFTDVPGRTDLVEHAIQLTTTKPVRVNNTPFHSLECPSSKRR